ncbi:MAG: carbon-nitrogen family hydrolase [Candidatus Loosdrechtia sp.]|uniref:carbon-nitrogen family hydrolase n=1 Tax=Candidatus Loosdrechtia sp. TaxID=3101272 RepID=UPI003A618127|nr:MAG: carbon-nitrogen family hydrolase [Candidatus Jettenia sp. AMX2]
MKIALVQLDIRWESKKINGERAEEFIKKASHEKCDIVVFPEMFNTGFSMNIPTIVEDESGETASVLSDMAKRYEINLIAGFPAKASDGKKGKNLAVVFDRKGERIARYVKIHPFSFASEDQHYTAGNDTVIFNIEGMSASIFICYDLRFPEVFRSIAKDVQAIFVIANWPSSRKEHWVTLLKARAIENQCFVIGVNRTGTDGNGIHYPGASRVIDPSGMEICSGNDADEFTTCMINPLQVAETRARFPFLSDMRFKIRG